MLIFRLIYALVICWFTCFLYGVLYVVYVGNSGLVIVLRKLDGVVIVFLCGLALLGDLLGGIL